jgi:hypothetical protein
MDKFIANPVIVEAGRITNVVKKTYLDGRLPEYTVTIPGLEFNGKLIPVTLDSGMTARMVPAVGDYYVKQEDGYVYINPKYVFERKYRPLVN